MQMVMPVTIGDEVEVMARKISWGGHGAGHEGTLEPRRGKVIWAGPRHCVVDLGSFKESFTYDRVSRVLAGGSVEPALGEEFRVDVLEQEYKAETRACKEIDRVIERSSRVEMVEVDPEERYDKVVEMYNAGITYAEMQLALGIESPDIGRFVKRGFAEGRITELRGRRGKSTTMEVGPVSGDDVQEKSERAGEEAKVMHPDERMKLVVKLKNRGKTYEQIAAAVGMSQGTVANDIRKAKDLGLISGGEEASAAEPEVTVATDSDRDTAKTEIEEQNARDSAVTECLSRRIDGIHEQIRELTEIVLEKGEQHVDVVRIVDRHDDALVHLATNYVKMVRRVELLENVLLGVLDDLKCHFHKHGGQAVLPSTLPDPGYAEELQRLYQDENPRSGEIRSILEKSRDQGPTFSLDLKDLDSDETAQNGSKSESDVA